MNDLPGPGRMIGSLKSVKTDRDAPPRVTGLKQDGVIDIDFVRPAK